jgi:hypothetical protein
MAFLGYDCRARRAATYTRYPFMQSTESEQASLFSRSSNATGDIMRAVGRQALSQLSDV